jgi:membrane-bound lytic murein transglycosylase MltF
MGYVRRVVQDPQLWLRVKNNVNTVEYKRYCNQGITIKPSWYHENTHYFRENFTLWEKSIIIKVCDLLKLHLTLILTPS